MLQDTQMDTCQEHFQCTLQLVALSLEKIEKDSKGQAHDGQILRQSPMKKVLAKGVLQ